VTARVAPSRRGSEDLAGLGTATVHESGAHVVDLDPHQLVTGSAVAGPARLPACAAGDNLAVHEVIGHVEDGDVLVLTMAEPNRYGMLGELLAHQAITRGAPGVVVDGGVRDTDRLRALCLPIWARSVPALRTAKSARTAPAECVVMGGVEIHVGDVVVTDADRVVITASARLNGVLDAARNRALHKERLRARIDAGATTNELFGLGS